MGVEESASFIEVAAELLCSGESLEMEFCEVVEDIRQVFTMEWGSLRRQVSSVRNIRVE